MPWRFRAADLDVAGHVNNSVYWEPVEEAIWRTEEPAADLEIEYRDPAQPGEAAVASTGSVMWITDPLGAVHASIVGLPGG